jgi:glyoxylase-like metal-dependent hydrolase (beta-lactamase superfamily II)
MSYRIIPLCLWYYTGEMGYMTYMMNYGQPIIRPFVVWFIEGAKKNILVDTGIDGKDYLAYHPHFRNLDITEIHSFRDALDSINLRPDRIDVVIQTHLHFDHCYNLKRCTKADVLVQEAEYNFAGDPAPFQAIYRRDLWEGARLELIRGEYEVEPGITIMPVPGHSPGGQAVLVNTEKGIVAISGMCTCNENFHPSSSPTMVGEEDMVLPGILWNARLAYESMKLLKGRADIILPLHEPSVLEVEAIP